MAQTSTEGDQTRRSILRIIAMGGPIARTSIANELNLSPATITASTRELIDAGLIEMTSKAPATGRGRPSELLAIVLHAVSLVGVKVMEHHVTGVIADLRGDAQDEFDADFDPRTDDPAAGITQILDTVVDLDSARVLGIGLGVPGMVDTNGDGRVSSPMFGWQDLPLGRQVRELTGLPVIVDNDVNTLAVAERLYGRARSGGGDFLTVTLGRGLGLGISMNGAVHRGPHGGTGELGHTHVMNNDRTCDCGRVGCLETIVGEPGLLMSARQAGAIDTTGDMDDLRRAADRPGAAADTLHDAGAHLGRAMANLVNLLGPDLVIISGEGLPSWPYMEAGFHATFTAGRLSVHEGVEVVVDQWHDRNWARGAASLVLRSVFAAPRNAIDPETDIRNRLQTVGKDGVS